MAWQRPPARHDPNRRETRRPYPALTRLICQLDLDLDRTTPRGAGARAEEPGAPEEPRGVPGAVSARVRIVLGLPAPRC
jgi:hypothetical protein